MMNIDRNIKVTKSNAQSSGNIRMVPLNTFAEEQENEIYIHIFKPKEKQFDVLKFLDDGTSNYKLSEKSIFLQQMVNRRAVKVSNEPEFGMGSSYKKERTATTAQSNAPPSYAITIDKGKAQRKFKTVPEQLNPTSQYMVLIRKSKSVFHAYPVEHLHRVNTFSQLDIESIEENERAQLTESETFNKCSKKFTGKYEVAAPEHLKNNIQFGNEDNELSDSEKLEQDVLKKRKRNDMFQRIRHGKRDCQVESDQDDRQGDEVDYMSDSSIDEDKLSEDEKDKIYDEVDVVQEQFLIKEVELSDDEENESKKKEEKNDDENSEAEDEKDNEENDDADDDDDDDEDDSDDDDGDDVVEDKVHNRKQKYGLNNKPVHVAVKRPNSDHDSNQLDSKRRKLSDYKVDVIVEEIRKCLKKKPSSAKDLFKILVKMNLLANNNDSKQVFMDCIKQLKLKMETVHGVNVYKL